jgi:chromosome segregation ATPase
MPKTRGGYAGFSQPGRECSDPRHTICTMLRPFLSSPAQGEYLRSTEASDLVYGLEIAGITVAVVVAAVLVVALVLLFRNRQGAQPTAAAGFGPLTTRANGLLVRADEALTAADNELGYAIAQFGEARTAAFAGAVASARTTLQEAFRLRHTLDDAYPESAQKARDWTLQIIALCEKITTEIESHDRTFTTKRGEEVDAPGRLTAVRQAISETSDRIAPTLHVLESLADRYDAELIGSLNSVAVDVRRLLNEASEHADTAQAGLSPAGVNAVTDKVRAAEDRVQRAGVALDAAGVREAELAAASDALASLTASAEKDVIEAKRHRDAAPDPQTGAQILAAIDGVTAALNTASATNPGRSLDSLTTAIAALDTALASARNQKERLEHARIALAGTLVSAKSQLSEVRAIISRGSGRVGADARTRLAEAERQLMLAEAEADPVEALDAARRAVTHARDADALARYDSRGKR